MKKKKTDFATSKAKTFFRLIDVQDWKKRTRKVLFPSAKISPKNVCLTDLINDFYEEKFKHDVTFSDDSATFHFLAAFSNETLQSHRLLCSIHSPFGHSKRLFPTKGRFFPAPR